MRRSTAAAVVLAALTLTACDDMTGGAGGVPRVAGTYEGPMVYRFPDLGIEIPARARLTVVQSGAEVTIGGSVTLAGTTVAVTSFTGMINSTGFFTATDDGVSGTVSDETCGEVSADKLLADVLWPRGATC